MSNAQVLEALLQQVPESPSVRERELGGSLMSSVFACAEAKGLRVKYLVLPTVTQFLVASWSFLAEDLAWHTGARIPAPSLWGARILYTDKIQKNLGYAFTEDDFSVGFTWDVTPEPSQKNESAEENEPAEENELAEENESTMRCPHCGEKVLVVLRKERITGADPT